MEDREPEAQEPETECTEHLEEETPTEDQEPTASETQAEELATVEVLAEEIEDLRARAAERDDLLNKLQRSRADFINYQRRVQRERERWSEMTKQEFALQLLPILDDCERALQASAQNHDPEALARGFELIHAKLLKTLANEGVQPFDPINQPFDPAYHEAIAHIEKPDVPDNTIIEVVRKGYTIGERVLRPAQVVVAKGHKKPQDQPPTPEEQPGEN